MLVHRSQSVTSDVSVDLGGRKIGVAQELLDGPEVGSALEQVRRVGVAQGVRVQDPPVGQRVALEDAPGVTGSEHPAEPVQEEPIGRFGPGEEPGGRARR